MPEKKTDEAEEVYQAPEEDAPVEEEAADEADDLKHFVREDGVEVDLTDGSDKYREKLAKEGKIEVPDDDDFLDGCEFSDDDETISDEDIDGIVLFAGVAGGDLEAIEKRRQEWLELFGGV